MSNGDCEDATGRGFFKDKDNQLFLIMAVVNYHNYSLPLASHFQVSVHLYIFFLYNSEHMKNLECGVILTLSAGGGYSCVLLNVGVKMLVIVSLNI